MKNLERYERWFEWAQWLSLLSVINIVTSFLDVLKIGTNSPLMDILNFLLHQWFIWLMLVFILKQKIIAEHKNLQTGDKSKEYYSWRRKRNTNLIQGNHIRLVIILILGYFLFFKIPAKNHTSIPTPKQFFNNSAEIKPQYVKIKYRDSVVDVNSNNFEYLDTSISSFIHGVWYDIDNQYVVIKLKETYYQYCGVPTRVWNSLKKTNSFGSFYNKNLKGNYDCRVNYEPVY